MASQPLNFRQFTLSTFFILMFTLTSGLYSPASAEGDPEAGEQVFKKCGTCHKIGPEAKNAVGPVLNGVIGRPAGTFPDYKYGKSTKAAGEAGLVWTEDLIFDYLADPKKFLRAFLDDRKARSKMAFKLKDEDDRRNVIAYIATFSSDAEAGGGEPADQSSTDENDASASVAAIPIEQGVCVTNRSGSRLLFVAEARGGTRRVAMLGNSETLCARASDRGGTIGVFENEDALEGCSRLAATGKPEQLLAYSAFDNCRWES